MSKIATPRGAISSAEIEKQRELKFKLWLQQKSLKEKALEYLAKLDSDRAEERESLREVGIALYAIDRALLGTETTLNAALNKDVGEPDSSGGKSLQSAWRKWAMEHHNFNNVILADSEVSQLSGAVHEFLDKDKDPETGKEFWILPSLKYFFPAAPKPHEKPKPLSSDQKIQNSIFIKECKRLWGEAKKECELRIQKQLNGIENRIEDKVTISEMSEKSSKEYDEDEAKDGRDSITLLPLTNTIVGNARPSKSLSKVLSDLSIKVLREWIEEDEDKALMKQKQDLNEKLTSSKKAHEEFVRQKDSLRIRLPDSSAVIETVKPTRFSYGRELSSVRPQKASQPTSTVELMAGSGLKYVHATNKGKNGMIGDLERSRAKLLNMGFVKKENFDTDPDSRYSLQEYDTQKVDNKAISEKQARLDKMKEANAKAYDEWLIQKDLRDQALKYLAYIPRPHGSVMSTSSTTNATMNMSMNASIAVNIEKMLQNMNKAPDSIFNTVVNVGKALKSVDRTLVQEWTTWCNNFLPGTYLIALWDFFPPQACDVHCAAYSQIKDTFLKLLRPGLDYQDTFQAYFEKKWGKLRNSNAYADDDKEKLQAELALSKKDMVMLLRQMGVVMNETEMRLLVDAFDANGDGMVTMSEFLEFTGPKRDKKAGVSMAMNQRCCWVTTCKKIGMPHAYTITQFKGEGTGVWGDVDTSSNNKKGDKSESKDDANRSYYKYAYRSTEVLTMKNGEKRLKLESTERKKREAFLLRCHLLDDGQEEEKDNYEDDYENEIDNEYGEEDDQRNNKSKGPASGGSHSVGGSCAYVKWTTDKRKEGLKYLGDATRTARQESTLKELISSGVPPKAPQLWCGKLGDTKVGEEYDTELLTDEILLLWAPLKHDLVSFFSVEFGGSLASVAKTAGTLAANYREVYRDPPDSNLENEFKFQFWMKNLKPCTGYLFRIRAINGYGPGEYTYKTLWTRPLTPPQPRVVACSSDSATLRWVFNDVFLKKEDDLKALFQDADVDQSGLVSREELKSLIEDRADSKPELHAFLRKLTIKYKLVEGDFGSLFDMIEGDDDSNLSWEEFQAFFMNAGWSGDSVRASHQSALSTAAAASNTTVYTVLRCESELTDTYEEVMRTSKESTTVHRLEAGKSYRFKVQAVNPDGVASGSSDSVVVHTMLETPQPPSEVTVEARQITLQWRQRTPFVHSKDKELVRNMLGEWAGHLEEEHSVSVEVAFSKYDSDRSGTIDRRELAALLEDLSVEPTEERIAEALTSMDLNGDGVISYEEFCDWWRAKDVFYTVKRSEALAPVPKNNSLGMGSASATAAANLRVSAESRLDAAVSVHAANNTSTAAAAGYKLRRAPLPVVSYRGSQRSCVIAGLMPNRMYHFALRQTGARSHSMLSNPLVAMTVPFAPSSPVVVRVTATVAVIKWYAPEYGVSKFSVQLQAKGQKWVTVYDGQDTTYTSTTLVPECEYSVRIIGVNCQGRESESSRAVTFKTLPRNTKEQLTIRNADNDFSIECTGDVCVGDTIVITERLYAREVPKNTAGPVQGLNSSMMSNARSISSKVSRHKSTTAPKHEEVEDDNMTLSQGVFIGERTIAANVIRDNYRTARDAYGGSIADKKFYKMRRLWLEVVWQKASNDACKPYEVKPGVVIERQQAQIEKFEVFRVAWCHESQRRSLKEELVTLSECFATY